MRKIFKQKSQTQVKPNLVRLHRLMVQTINTGHIFSLKIRIDSCYWGLQWTHWAQTNFIQTMEKANKNMLIFIHSIYIGFK